MVSEVPARVHLLHGCGHVVRQNTWQQDVWYKAVHLLVDRQSMVMLAGLFLPFYSIPNLLDSFKADLSHMSIISRNILTDTSRNMPYKLRDLSIHLL